MCLPGLHISLGIFQRLFDLLEEECHNLDLLLAAHSDTELPSDVTPAFQRFCDTFAKLHQHKEKLSTERQQASFLEQTMTLLAINIPMNQQENDVQLQVVQSEAQACRKRVAEIVMKNAYSYTYRYTTCIHLYCSPCFKESQIKMLEAGVNKGVSVESGVFVRALEKALKKFYVERQAYWSGAFVGNHVHKTLKVVHASQG